MLLLTKEIAVQHYVPSTGKLVLSLEYHGTVTEVEVGRLDHGDGSVAVDLTKVHYIPPLNLSSIPLTSDVLCTLKVILRSHWDDMM